MALGEEEKTEDPYQTEFQVPPWINSDRDARITGKLLYIEDWATHGKFNWKDHEGFGFMIFLIGLVLLLLGASSSVDIFSGLFGFCGFFILSYGIIPLLLMQTAMPFSIYRNGITLPKVSIFQGFSRQERFIPWSDISTVKLMGDFASSAPRHVFITIEFLDTKLKPLVLNSANLSRPFSALKVMISCIPDRIDPDCYALFDTEMDWESVEQGGSKRIELTIASDRSKRKILFLISMICFNLSLSIAVFPFLSEGRESNGSLLGIHIFLLFIGSCSLGASYLYDARLQDLLMYRRAEFSPDGISFPTTFVASCFHPGSGHIPINSIRVIRVELDRTSYTHISEIETVSGSRFRVPLSIYSMIRDDPDFIESDHELHNQDASSHIEISPPSHRIPGIGLLITIIILPTLFFGLIHPAFLVFRKIPSLISFLFILLISVAFLFRTPLGRAIDRILFQVGTEVRITKDSIVLRDKAGTMRTITRDSIRGLGLVRGSMVDHILVESQDGSFRLRLPTLPHLIDHGYHVRGVIDVPDADPTMVPDPPSHSDPKSSFTLQTPSNLSSLPHPPAESDSPPRSDPDPISFPAPQVDTIFEALPQYSSPSDAQENLLSEDHSTRPSSPSDSEFQGYVIFEDDGDPAPPQAVHPENEKVLFEEPAIMVKRDRIRLLIQGCAALFIASMILIFSLETYPPDNDFNVIGSGLTMACSVPMATLGIIFLLRTKHLRPTVFFKHKVFMSGTRDWLEDLYIPYGAFPAAIRPSYIEQQTTPIFIRPNVILRIQRRWQGLRDSIPDINREISNQRVDPQFQEFSFAGRMQYFQIAATGAAVFIGFLFATLYITILNSSIGAIHHVGWDKLIVWGSIFSLILLAILSYYLEFTKKFVLRVGRESHMNVRMFAATVIILILLVIAGYSVNQPIEKETEIIIDREPWTSAHISGIIVDEDIHIIDNNILILNGSRLVIENSTITMSVHQSKGSMIFVAPRGVLEIRNSTITNSTAFGYDYGYGFEIHGTAIFENSTFTGLLGPQEISSGDGGIEIYSDRVQVLNCTIRNNSLNGMLIKEASPIIDGCTFEQNGNDAIEMHGSGAQITNCTFRGNRYGISIRHDSEATISGCTFVNNSNGITIYSQDIKIVDSVFENNTQYAIGIGFGHSVDIENVRFLHNGNDKKVLTVFSPEYQQSFCFFTLCGIAILIVIVLVVFIQRGIHEEPLMTIEEIDRLYRRRDKFG